MAQKVPTIGKICGGLYLGCACCGCAMYGTEQQPQQPLPQQRQMAISALENKLEQAEWRIILFRWPPEVDYVVVDGVTNRVQTPFLPYFHGFSDGDEEKR
jgi:hypothetical protein